MCSVASPSLRPVGSSPLLLIPEAGRYSALNARVFRVSRALAVLRGHRPSPELRYSPSSFSLFIFGASILSHFPPLLFCNPPPSHPSAHVPQVSQGSKVISSLQSKLSDFRELQRTKLVPRCARKRSFLSSSRERGKETSYVSPTRSSPFPLGVPVRRSYRFRYPHLFCFSYIPFSFVYIAS